MPAPVAALVFLCAAALAGLLASERAGWRAGVWIAKPLASLAFVGVAVAGGAGESGFGRALLAGLVLCLAGDVLLIPRESQASFRAGVLAFLSGHLVYAGAFLWSGLDPQAAGVAAALCAGIGAGVWRWLRPHLPGDMVGDVLAYVVVISAMLVCAVGAAAAGAPWLAALGALLFYLSDLSVARDRFVLPAFANGAWGLPAYYGGQVLIALAAAG